MEVYNYWLKNKINTHLSVFGNPSVRIYRDFANDVVTIDFFGGRCASYTYSGKWIAG